MRRLDDDDDESLGGSSRNTKKSKPRVNNYVQGQSDNNTDRHHLNIQTLHNP